MTRMRVIRSSALVLAVMAWAGSAQAQSLTSVRGPGYPVLPADARTLAMGGLGVGFHGPASTLINPAAHAYVLRRGVVVAVEAMERNVRLGNDETGIGTTRFPLMLAVFPMGPAVLTAGYGGYLDQSWGLIRTGEELIGADTVGYTDVLRSQGGIGQFQVGAAVPLGRGVGVGASVGLHTGSQRVDYSRRFEPREQETLDPFTEISGWRYRGPVAQVGVQWDPAEIIRLGASVTWAGTLVGEATDGRAERRELELPLQVAGGVSGVLVPGLTAGMSARWSGWSGTDPHSIGIPGGNTTAQSRDTWEMGGGVEWAAPRPGAPRTYPLRAGFQYRQLPFPFGETAPTEWFAGGGLGVRVGPDRRNPLAAVDLAVQRGVRSGARDALLGELTESMWRVALSVSLFGS
jgi:hypothetical protein